MRRGARASHDHRHRQSNRLGLLAHPDGEALDYQDLEGGLDHERDHGSHRRTHRVQYRVGLNARDVKNVPVRLKSDELEAVWPCKLTERGMLRPSFSPPAEICELRNLHLAAHRHRQRPQHCKQGVEKLLEYELVKL